jgi:hypothetical protein
MILEVEAEFRELAFEFFTVGVKLGIATRREFA